MPRYYFDIQDGDQTNADRVGIDLDSDQIARNEATKTLTEIAAQEIPGDGDHRTLRIVVHDSQRNPIFEVRIEFQLHPTHNDSPHGGGGAGDNHAS